MQTRTQPKRTEQQAVNFGPNLLVDDVGSSIVLPTVLWAGPSFGRPGRAGRTSSPAAARSLDDTASVIYIA